MNVIEALEEIFNFSSDDIKIKDYFPIQCAFIKNTILYNQEKAEKYDDLQLPFSHRVYIKDLEDEIKKLKEENDMLKLDLCETKLENNP